jgi:hypothetical protein
VRVVAAAFALFAGSSAHADEAVELHTTDAPSDALSRDVTEPLLHLEPMLRSYAEGLASDIERERVDYMLGPRTRLQIESQAWTGSLFNAQGWGATARFVHRFKSLELGLEAGYTRVDSISTHASYRHIGLSLTYRRKLSQWMTAWISLTAGQRVWLDGAPPPGEANDTVFMLNVGTTFR